MITFALNMTSKRQLHSSAEFFDLYNPFLARLVNANLETKSEIYRFAANYFEEKLKERNEHENDPIIKKSFLRDISAKHRQKHIKPNFSYDGALDIPVDMNIPSIITRNLGKEEEPQDVNRSNDSFPLNRSNRVSDFVSSDKLIQDVNVNKFPDFSYDADLDVSETSYEFSLIKDQNDKEENPKNKFQAFSSKNNDLVPSDEASKGREKTENKYQPPDSGNNMVSSDDAPTKNENLSMEETIKNKNTFQNNLYFEDAAPPEEAFHVPEMSRNSQNEVTSNTASTFLTQNSNDALVSSAEATQVLEVNRNLLNDMIRLTEEMSVHIADITQQLDNLKAKRNQQIEYDAYELDKDEDLKFQTRYIELCGHSEDNMFPIYPDVSYESFKEDFISSNHCGLTPVNSTTNLKDFVVHDLRRDYTLSPSYSEKNKTRQLKDCSEHEIWCHFLRKCNKTDYDEILNVFSFNNLTDSDLSRTSLQSEVSPECCHNSTQSQKMKFKRFQATFDFRCVQGDICIYKNGSLFANTDDVPVRRGNWLRNLLLIQMIRRQKVSGDFHNGFKDLSHDDDIFRNECTSKSSDPENQQNAKILKLKGGCSGDSLIDISPNSDVKKTCGGRNRITSDIVQKAKKELISADIQEPNVREIDTLSNELTDFNDEKNPSFSSLEFLKSTEGSFVEELKIPKLPVPMMKHNLKENERWLLWDFKWWQALRTWYFHKKLKEYELLK